MGELADRVGITPANLAVLKNGRAKAVRFATLVTSGVLRRDRACLTETDWGLIAADEAQHVENPYSATARELPALPSRARVALTGTPVENNLSELWFLLYWTTPGLLGTLSAFRERHARAVESGQDPDAAIRLSRLVRPFLLRRRKNAPGIAPEPPSKTETDPTLHRSDRHVSRDRSTAAGTRPERE